MKGIVLFAFGDQSYMKWAENQALSIKVNSDLPIQLIHDKEIIKYRDRRIEVFDELTPVDDKVIYQEIQQRGRKIQKLEPGIAKLSVYDKYAFEENIILDVDGVTFKDLNELFELCNEQGGSYYSQFQGEGVYQDSPWSDMIWARPSELYDHYGLDPSFEMPFINSSFQYVKKNHETQELFEIAHDLITNNPLPRNKHYHPWGGGQPDELYMNLALGMTGISPKLLSLPQPYYFGTRQRQKPIREQVFKKHFGFGLWGGHGLNPSYLLEWYDALMQGYFTTVKIPHANKAHKLIKKKFVHQK